MSGLLSPHFSEAEFTATSHRALLDEQEAAWKADPFLRENAQILCVSVLEVIRGMVGPLRISSGFRCEALNQAVGGAPNSLHTLALAADVLPLKTPLPTAMGIIREAVRAGALPDVDRVIYEFGRWIHVQRARRGAKPTGQTLMTFNGRDFALFDAADPRVRRVA